MYGLRLFIVVLQELHCSLNCLHICMISVKGHQVLLLYTLWFLRYLNALPEAVYCCYTRTILFIYLSVRKVSFLNSVWLLRYAC